VVHEQYTIEVADDASSWRAGDQIVIASTDFDWTQAETFTIESADGTTINMKGDCQYTHYGEIYDGMVDMRAEVGLLTRYIINTHWLLRSAFSQGKIQKKKISPKNSKKKPKYFYA
jgi:hypothetical protein